MRPALPMNAFDLMPHRPPLLLLDRLLEKSENAAKAEGTAPEKGIMVDGAGKILPEYVIELMAQAMAAIHGYECLEEGKENQGGFLASLDAFSWHAPALPGAGLVIDLEKILVFDAITCFEGRITQGEVLIAQGAVKVWEAVES